MTREDYLAAIRRQTPPPADGVHPLASIFQRAVDAGWQPKRNALGVVFTKPDKEKST